MTLGSESQESDEYRVHGRVDQRQTVAREGGVTPCRVLTLHPWRWPWTLSLGCLLAHLLSSVGDQQGTESLVCRPVKDKNGSQSSGWN